MGRVNPAAKRCAVLTGEDGRGPAGAHALGEGAVGESDDGAAAGPMRDHPARPFTEETCESRKLRIVPCREHGHLVHPWG